MGAVEQAVRLGNKGKSLEIVKIGEKYAEFVINLGEID